MCHGDDNGLRVPPRLAPDAGAGDGRQGRRRRARRGGEVAGRAARRRRPGGLRRPGRHPLRTAGRQRRASRLSGTDRGRPARSRRRQRRPGAALRRVEDPDADRRRCRGGRWPRSTRTSRRCTTRRRRAPRRDTADVKTLANAIEAAGVGFARIPWSKVGTAGEAKANEARRLRALPRPGGRSVPDSEDEKGLVAYLARSY